MVGRRTRVANAPTDVPPVQAGLDGDDAQDRTDLSPGESRETSTASAFDAPISILDLFGPPATPATPTAGSAAPPGSPPVQRKSIGGPEHATPGGTVASEIAGRGVSGGASGSRVVQRSPEAGATGAV